MLILVNIEISVHESCRRPGEDGKLAATPEIGSLIEYQRGGSSTT